MCRKSCSARVDALRITRCPPQSASTPLAGRPGPGPPGPRLLLRPPRMNEHWPAVRATRPAATRPSSPPDRPSGYSRGRLSRDCVAAASECALPVGPPSPDCKNPPIWFWGLPHGDCANHLHGSADRVGPADLRIKRSCPPQQIGVDTDFDRFQADLLETRGAASLGGEGRASC